MALSNELPNRNSLSEPYWRREALRRRFVPHGQLSDTDRRDTGCGAPGGQWRRPRGGATATTTAAKQFGAHLEALARRQRTGSSAQHSGLARSQGVCRMLQGILDERNYRGELGSSSLRAELVPSVGRSHAMPSGYPGSFKHRRFVRLLDHPRAVVSKRKHTVPSSPPLCVITCNYSAGCRVSQVPGSERQQHEAGPTLEQLSSAQRCRRRGFKSLWTTSLC